MHIIWPLNRRPYMLHTEPSLRIYFGDGDNQLFPENYLAWHDNLLLKPQFKNLTPLNLKKLFFLHQVHGITGKVITNDLLFSSFQDDGDFLITQDSYIGLGVMTADCVPVIAYDKKHHLIGIAHAGWRGTVGGVVLEMIKTMQTSFGTQIHDLKLFFGPSAKNCCYEVDDSFYHHLEDYFFGSDYLIKQKTGIYFDLPGFLVQQLASHLNLPRNQIVLNYNMCTICNERFWSYRRGTKKGAPQNIGRQMTVITLW